MSETTQKRATVYFEPHLHRALRLKAAETDRSISELVNDAVCVAEILHAEQIASVSARTLGNA